MSAQKGIKAAAQGRLRLLHPRLFVDKSIGAALRREGTKCNFPPGSQSPTEPSNKSVPSTLSLGGYETVSWMSLHSWRDVCCQHDTSYLLLQSVPRYSNCPKDHACSEERYGKGCRAKPTGLQANASGNTFETPWTGKQSTLLLGGPD